LTFRKAFRKNNVPDFLLRKPTSDEVRALADTARDAMTDSARQARGVISDGARQAADYSARTMRDPSRRLKAGVVATVAIGTVAGVGAAAPWASAATPPATTSASVSQGGTQTIYDSTNPTSIPAGQTVATYSNGSFQASNASVAGRGNVLWIDTNGSNTHAKALDVEPGDATPAGAAQWVSHKLTDNPNTDAIVYTFKSDWSAVQGQINTLPGWMQSHVKYWIADPTGTPHILPGSSATQWDWSSNYDISMTQPGFFS
jgi:hypothetical protein